MTERTRSDERVIQYDQCAFWDCTKAGGHWIGDDSQGRESYVCEEHLQHCELTEMGWIMHRSLEKARERQVLEEWE